MLWITIRVKLYSLNASFPKRRSRKLSFTNNIRGIRSNFAGCPIFPWIKLFWYSLFMWDKLENSIYSSNFSVKVKSLEGFCCSYAWTWRRYFFCAGLTPRKFWGFLYVLRIICFRLVLLHSVSYLFLYRSTSCLCSFWCYFSWHRWDSLSQHLY